MTRHEMIEHGAALLFAFLLAALAVTSLVVAAAETSLGRVVLAYYLVMLL